MTDERQIRASDDDRQHVVDLLREQTALGRLTLDEFELRMGAAYTVKTWAELRNLASDLPVTLMFDTSTGKGRLYGFQGTKNIATRGRVSVHSRIPSRLGFALLISVLLYLSVALEWGPQWAGFVEWLLLPGLALWGAKRTARTVSRRRASALPVAAE